MDFLQFGPSPEESAFTASSPHFQAPGSLSIDASTGFDPVDGDIYASGFDLYDELHLQQNAGLSQADDSDMANRARLSHEQLAQLEREFKQRPKPNTDYKRQLSEAMGVDYQKVNHSQEPKINLSIDETHDFIQSSLPPLGHENTPKSQSVSQLSSPIQANFTSSDYVATLENQALLGNRIGQKRPPTIGRCKPNATFGNLQPLQMGFLNAMGTDPIWSLSDGYHSSLPKDHEPVMMDDSSLAWSTPNGEKGPINPLVPPQPRNIDDQDPYLNTLQSKALDIASSETFAAVPAKMAHPEIITPPQEVSPMPGLTEGDFSRRDSNSSDLAENFDTIHLQQSNIGLGLYQNPSSTPISVKPSNLIPATGLMTPNISPDSVAAKPPLANGRDLASRRHRPRPAALQPQAARSVSLTGPPTSSPHLRVSSPVTGRSSPVRRIRSSGNCLSVATGRISKSGTTSTPRSPRNYESCFQLEDASKFQSNAVSSTNPSKPSFNPQNPTLASSDPRKEVHPPAWIDLRPQTFAPGLWDVPGQSPVSNLPANFTLPPSPPNNFVPSMPLEHSASGQMQSHHCPPQSAPPHLTSFFDGSPPMPPCNFGQGGWPTPSITPPDSYRHGQNTRPSHSLHHSQSQPYSFLPESIHGIPGVTLDVGSFHQYQTPFSRLPTSVKKELDIKIEKGPPPPKELLQTSQENKTYCFNNSTPEDFASESCNKK